MTTEEHDKLDKRLAAIENQVSRLTSNIESGERNKTALTESARLTRQVVETMAKNMENFNTFLMGDPMHGVPGILVRMHGLETTQDENKKKLLTSTLDLKKESKPSKGCGGASLVGRPWFHWRDH